MTTRHGGTTDDILAAWERSTNRPAPGFAVPVAREWRRTGSLVLVGALVALLAGAVAVGATLRPVEPTLETGFASLADMDAARFHLRFEVTIPDGREGFTAEGIAVPPDRAVTATGQSIRADGEWPFDGAGSGALVLVDGRLFVRHADDPWVEVDRDAEGDEGPAVLARVLDSAALSRALLAAAVAAERVSSDHVPCGDEQCTSHDVVLDRAQMHALAEAISGLSVDEPAPDVGPVTATVVLDPDGRLVSLDAGFSEDEGSVRLRLDLEELDEAPTIEAPIP